MLLKDLNEFQDWYQLFIEQNWKWFQFKPLSPPNCLPVLVSFSSSLKRPELEMTFTVQFLFPSGVLWRIILIWADCMRYALLKDSGHYQYCYVASLSTLSSISPRKTLYRVWISVRAESMRFTSANTMATINTVTPLGVRNILLY